MFAKMWAVIPTKIAQQIRDGKIELEPGAVRWCRKQAERVAQAYRDKGKDMIAYPSRTWMENYGTQAEKEQLSQTKQAQDHAMHSMRRRVHA